VRALRTWLPPVVFLALLLEGWELWVGLKHEASYVLPTPVAISKALYDSRHVLGGHVATTLEETLIGLLVGTVAGVALAIAISAIPFVRRAVWPLVVTSQTIPMLVLAPLLALGFGFGMAPKVVVVALIVFFPVAVSTVAGLASADREQVDLVRSMGASSVEVLRLVLLPSALPDFFSGLKIAATYAVAGAVIGEWVGGSSGLMIFINRSERSYRTDQVYAGVAMIAVLSMALFGCVELIARWAMPWRRPSRPRPQESS
jgi:ABC-type nitrate/sulfonate/bicarbonate transport system permease component